MKQGRVAFACKNKTRSAHLLKEMALSESRGRLNKHGVWTGHDGERGTRHEAGSDSGIACRVKRKDSARSGLRVEGMQLREELPGL